MAAIRVGGRVVGGVVPGAGKSRPRLMSEMVLDFVLAMMVAPVASLIATPVGFVPVATSGTIGCFEGLGVKSRMEAVPLPLLATTARPRRWLMAMPCGEVPTPMGLPRSWPNVELAGLISMIEMLLHPLTLIAAIGEKGPLPIWSAIATEVGSVLVGLAL